MREAIGNTYVFYFVVVFTTIFACFLAGSIGYSKAFKIKNNIINIIEENRGWNNDVVKEEIDEMMKNIGYSVTPNGLGKCPTYNGTESVYKRENGYNYCVYPLNQYTNYNETKISEYRGEYYRVVTYISFDIPVINRVLRIPVQGETKNIFDLEYPQ